MQAGRNVLIRHRRPRGPEKISAVRAFRRQAHEPCPDDHDRPALAAHRHGGPAMSAPPAVAPAAESAAGALTAAIWSCARLGLRTGFVALYGEKNPEAGLTLTMRTVEKARHNSRVLTGLAVLHAAEAWAMLGRRQDCEQALSEAEACFERIGNADDAADRYSPTHHGRLAGSCYLFLGDAKRAEPILADSARALGDRPKSQAIVLGNLALARIRQQKLDEAAATLHSAMDVIEMTWGGGGLNIVFDVGRELRPWLKVPVVQDVYDRLLTLMAAA